MNKHQHPSPLYINKHQHSSLPSTSILPVLHQPRARCIFSLSSFRLFDGSAHCFWPSRWWNLNMIATTVKVYKQTIESAADDATQIQKENHSFRRNQVFFLPCLSMQVFFPCLSKQVFLPCLSLQVFLPCLSMQVFLPCLSMQVFLPFLYKQVSCIQTLTESVSGVTTARARKRAWWNPPSWAHTDTKGIWGS